MSETTPLQNIRWLPFAGSLRRRLPSHPGRYLSLVDQGMVALCRFAAIVVFARLLSPEEFGAIALAMAVAILFVGFARATFTLPFAAFCSDRDRLAEDGSKWFAFMLFLVTLSFVLPLVTAVALHVASAPLWITHTAMYSALLSPTTILYEMSRRWLFQWERFRSLLLQGMTCSAVSAVSLVAMFVLRSPWIAVLALTLGYLVGSVGGLWANFPKARMRVSDIARVWREIRHFARWTIVEFMADSLQSYGMNIAVAFFGGPVGASVFAATRNVVAPVYTMTSAMASELPRLAQSHAVSGIHGLTRALRSTQTFMLAMSVPFLLIVSYYSEQSLHLLYGAKYAGLSTELRLWAVCALLLVIMRPLDMWLLVSLDSKTLFLRKLFGAAATIIVAVVLLPKFGVEGALYAIIAGMAVNVLGLLASVYGPRKPAAPS